MSLNFLFFAGLVHRALSSSLDCKNFKSSIGSYSFKSKSDHFFEVQSKSSLEVGYLMSNDPEINFILNNNLPVYRRCPKPINFQDEHLIAFVPTKKELFKFEPCDFQRMLKSEENLNYVLMKTALVNMPYHTPTQVGKSVYLRADKDFFSTMDILDILSSKGVKVKSFFQENSSFIFKTCYFNTLTKPSPFGLALAKVDVFTNIQMLRFKPSSKVLKFEERKIYFRIFEEIFRNLITVIGEGYYFTCEDSSCFYDIVNTEVYITKLKVFPPKQPEPLDFFTFYLAAINYPTVMQKDLRNSIDNVCFKICSIYVKSEAYYSPLFYDTQLRDIKESFFSLRNILTEIFSICHENPNQGETILARFFYNLELSSEPITKKSLISNFNRVLRDSFEDRSKNRFLKELLLKNTSQRERTLENEKIHEHFWQANSSSIVLFVVYAVGFVALGLGMACFKI